MDDNSRKELRGEYFNNVVKPKCKAEEIPEAYREFNMYTDGLDSNPLNHLRPEEIADLKNRDFHSMGLLNLNEQPSQEYLDAEKAQYEDQRGIVNAALKGRYGSTTAKLVKNYAGDTASGRGVQEFEDSGYQPETMGEKIAYGTTSMFTDLPLFVAGGGITTGGALAKTAGSFALPGTVGKMLELKEQNGGTLTLEDLPEALPEVAKEGAISGATGALVNIAGIPGKAIAGGITNPLKALAVEKAINIPGVTTALLGVEQAKGNEITADTVGETLGTIAIMELLGANPFAKSRVETKARELGVPVEKVAQNIDPDMMSRIKSVQDTEIVINNAAVKTEAQLKQEHINTVQTEIINKQLKANWKQGKPAEEVIQLTQIPKEYLPYVAVEVDGVLRPKPEVVAKVKSFLENKADPANNPFGDAGVLISAKSPVEKYQEIKDYHTAAITKYEQFKAEADNIRKQHVDEYIAKLGERRYEHLPNIRSAMDHAIDYALGHMTNTQMVRMIENPETIKSVLPAEAKYDSLKPTYQKSLDTELTYAMMQKTGYLPETLKQKAYKQAEFKMNRAEGELLKPIKATSQAGNAIKSDPEFQAEVENAKFQRMDDRERQAYLGKQLSDITKDYTGQIMESNEYHQPGLQKVLGTSPEFGDRALDPKTTYGSHFNNLVEWYKTPLESLTKTFEGMGYLNFKANAKAGIDNKSRIIQTRLGEKAYRAFADPIREATYTFTKELSTYKDKLKVMKEGLDGKAREQIGAYMLGSQHEALETLQRMKIEVPKWEQLSSKQQAVINEFNRINKMTFDRINASRELAGLEPIKKVDNYFTFIRKFNMIEKLGFDPLRVKTSVFDDVKIEDVNTRSLSFSFAKERGTSQRGLELDAFNVMDKYLYAALRTTHLTPIIGKLRMAIESEKLQLTNPNGYDYLNMTLDVVSGKKISEAKEITNYLANIVHRNLTSATLAYNAHTIAVQPSSAGLAGIEIGPKYLAMGAKDFFNPVMRNFAMKEAKTLLTRTYDTTMDEVKKGVTGSISKAQAKAIEIGNIPTKYTDLFAAEVTWLGGYRYAKDELNLNHKGCVTYADDLVVKTQGSADRLDLSPIQHTPLGKLATTFQTFAINQFGYLKDEVLGLGKEHKMVAQGISKKEALEKFDSTGYIRKPNGEGRFNIYETKRLKETPEALKKAAMFAVTVGIMNTIYELFGINPPNPAPASAFYEGLTGQGWVDTLYGQNPSKKDAQLTDAFLASIRETGMIVPIIGGAGKYGGSNAGGAFGSLLTDTFDILADRPAAKPWGFILAKWAGIPGATQTYKILKELKAVRTSDHKQAQRNADPMGYMKREMYKNSPFKKERYKDPGLVEGAIDQLLE
jgi:hypothetical protein